MREVGLEILPFRYADRATRRWIEKPKRTRAERFQDTGLEILTRSSRLALCKNHSSFFNSTKQTRRSEPCRHLPRTHYRNAFPLVYAWLQVHARALFGVTNQSSSRPFLHSLAARSREGV